MRTLRWIAGGMAITAAAVLGAWLLGLIAPLGPIVGGRLRGEVSTPPVDWSFADLGWLAARAFGAGRLTVWRGRAG